MSRLEANVWRYYVFQAVWILAFFAPVLVLFWEENGLDPLDIYLLQGIFAVAVVVLEVPTGMVADRMGKRTSLLAGSAVLVAGFVVYSLGHGFVVFLVAEIVVALGIALISGADAALLYDTLTALGRAGDYTRVEGKARAIQMMSIAACNVVGGIVGAYSYRATMWMTVAGPLVALIVAYGLYDINPQRRTASDGGRVPSYGSLIREALKFVMKHRLVRWQVMFLAVLSGSSTWLLWLYQPYMQFTGLPVVAFGVAFAVFNLFAALSSRLAHWFDKKLGREGSLWALSALQILPLPLLALVVTPASCLFILGHQAVRSIGRIIISDRILRYTYADKRSTILSIAALAGRLFFAITAPAIGWVAKHDTMESSLLTQGGLLAAVLLLLHLLYRRIPAKYFTVKQKVRDQQ